MFCRDLKITICQYLLNDTDKINATSTIYQEAVRREFSIKDYSEQEVIDFISGIKSSPHELLRKKLSLRPLLYFLSKMEPSSNLLLLCCQYGNKEALVYFLSTYEAVPSNDCFMECLRYGQLECFQVLSTYSEIPQDSVILAVTYNQKELLEYILSCGVSYISQTHAFYYSITSNKIELLRLLCPKNDLDLHYGLQLSVSEGISFDIFLFLSQRYNGSYYSCFMKACECGRLDIIQYIFNNGKSDDLSLDLGMRYASRGGYIDIIQFLRLRGCDYNPEAFSISVASNFPNIVEYFLRNGYRKNLEQDLVNACSRSRIKIVNLLIPYLQDVYIDIIRKYGSEECLSTFNIHK